MQKWEYRTFVRVCGIESDPCYQTNVWSKTSTWNPKEDAFLDKLGVDGWELVSIFPKQNEEFWVFKRLVE
jgi:hypothetical protein